MTEIVARYEDLTRAREAIAALERSGIESASIALEGRQAVRAAEEEDTALRDRRVAGHLGRRVVVGASVGTAIGAVAGFVVAAILLGGFGNPFVWAAAVGGAVAGGAVGGLLAGVATPAMSEDWELTHQAEPNGPIRVRVSTTDPHVRDRAARVLRDKDALSVEGA
jgi:hypothetical protein